MNLITDIYALNEKSITIVFGDEISLALADRISAFNQILHTNPFPGLITTVPAYASLTVHYDPIKVYRSDLKGNTCIQKVSDYIKSLKITETQNNAPRNRITIPVYYGGEFGPDIEVVAAHANLSTAEVIQLHSTATYLVHLIGFVPGFAYMGGLNKRLSTPRRKQPRAKVPAGAVGIAGEQTGIYPLDIPGGWQIIGQTPFKLFDPNRSVPALLKAGDEVVFQSITLDHYQSLL
ncbi:5-oxoprolinase subunit PxpB [Pedobacter rhizosphaerae]|uniref:Inhibitor of KinA n=1 Tax=Pedobacter rhizosphaerae TaxID=390241 RepID=A0A1H9U1G2_9SPHI|nr:5-oxoprolinase subunit PxpB [Pedobacter rhizosphaerae]SES03286.1 inhibitor of KinA [Pedobacter rhizosphaerae]